MLLPVLLLFFWQVEGAYKCSENGNNSVSFTKSQDDIRGRYTAELCILNNPRATAWEVDLSIYDTAICKSSTGTGLLVTPLHPHSVNTIKIDQHLNCSHVCNSMDFDLVYSSCYGLKSRLFVKNVGIKPSTTYHMVINNITQEQYSENKPHVIFVNHENEVTITWYLGIPATEYEVEVSKRETNGDQYSQAPQCVTQNCSAGIRAEEVRCRLALPPGYYDAALVHHGPWVAGLFAPQSRVVYGFELLPGGAPHVWGSAWGAGGAWGAGACAAAAALGAAALLVRRAHARRAYYKQVFEDWRRQRQESESSSVPGGQAPAPAAGPVLLVYAREGRLGQLAARALRDLLASVAGGPVLELFSAEALAAAAPSPAEWLRAQLAAPGARLVLLQSPAMALHAPRVDARAGTALGPLLGRRAMYAEPSAGDELLQLLLRLLADAPRDPAAYRKYYVAEYSGLPAELFPQTVPYRRYALPGLAAALARDVAGLGPAETRGAPLPAVPPEPLRAFRCACEAFVRHAADHPDYLMDELRLL